MRANPEMHGTPAKPLLSAKCSSGHKLKNLEATRLEFEGLCTAKASGAWLLCGLFHTASGPDAASECGCGVTGMVWDSLPGCSLPRAPKFRKVVIWACGACAGASTSSYISVYVVMVHMAMPELVFLRNLFVALPMLGSSRWLRGRRKLARR